MSLFSKRVTIGTTATLIHQADNDGVEIDVVLQKGANTDVHIGDGSVTTSTGFTLDALATPFFHIHFQMPAGESIYGVVASGTEVVHVLVSGDKSQ